MAARSVTDFLTFPHWVSEALSWDLGSANTRVLMGKQVVYHQPTCLTYHPATQSVVEIGQTAALSFDKQPGAVQVLFPIHNGSISHPTFAQLYVQAILTQLFRDKNRWPIIFGLTAQVGVPAFLTPVERTTLLNTLSRAGMSRVTLIPKTTAIHRTLSQQGIAHHHLCIIDIGAQTTEVGLFVGNECVSSTTLLMGGNHYTTEVRTLVRDEYESEIGWQSAEKLKHTYRQSLATKGTERSGEYKITTRGKHLVTGVPTTLSLSSTLLTERFETVTRSLLLELQTFLAQAPAELLTAALEDGIYFTGGGSLLPGLVELISQELKSHFSLSKHPLEDVVRGLAMGK